MTVHRFLYKSTTDALEPWQQYTTTIEGPDLYELHSTHREPIVGGVSIICVWTPARGVRA